MGNYVKDVISELLENKANRVYLLLFANNFESFKNQKDLSVIHIDDILSPIEMRIQQIITNKSIDLYIDATPMLGPHRPDLVNTKTLTICYDFIPLLYPSFYFASDQSLREYRNGLHRILKADKIVCISKSTRRDLELFLPDCKNSEVIYPKGELKFTSNKVKKKQILTSIGLHASKNYEELSTCITQIANNYPEWEINVIASSREWGEQFKESIPNTVRVLWDISSEQFSDFYEISKIYIHASAEEGFGIPVLNAINAGCTIVLADTNLNREIVTEQEDRYFFELTKENSMFEQTKRAIHEAFFIAPTTNNLQLKNTVSWNQAIASIEKYGENEINFLSPIPPQKCGIADYSEAVILELAKYYSVNIFSNGLVSQQLEFHKNINIFPWEYRIYEQHYFKSSKHIYQLGAAPWFRNILEDLISDRIPTSNKIVMIHDRNIGPGLYDLWNQNKNLQGFYENFLKFEDPEDATICFLTLKNLQNSEKVKQLLATFPLLKWLSKSTSKVLTHGLISQHILSNELIPMPSMLPKSIKHPFKIRNRNNAEEILLACFGRVSSNKRIEHVISAISLLRKQGYKASLLIVGELVDPVYFERLLKQVNLLDISNSVHFLGEVSDFAYWQYMIGVDYLISLRDESRGGLSAVLTNGLFVGKVILASDIPEHAVVSENVHLIKNDNAAYEIFQKIVSDKSNNGYHLSKNLISNKAAVTRYMEALR
jgi:glycosyltransferase involved in cell wall biosynthesis